MAFLMSLFSRFLQVLVSSSPSRLRIFLVGDSHTLVASFHRLLSAVFILLSLRVPFCRIFYFTGSPLQEMQRLETELGRPPERWKDAWDRVLLFSGKDCGEIVLFVPQRFGRIWQ